MCNRMLKQQWLTLLTAVNKKGRMYVVDNQCDPDSAVVVGYGDRVYHGRSDPYSARNRYNSGAGTGHSRPEGSVGFEVRT